MDIESKRENLKQIYLDHEDVSSSFKEDSICREGCIFCCTHYGSLDVTTLEGLLIYR